MLLLEEWAWFKSNAQTPTEQIIILSSTDNTMNPDKVVVKWNQSGIMQHSVAFLIRAPLWPLSSCRRASHPSLKSPINAAEDMKGFILTIGRRLIKILAPCNATANEEDYMYWRSAG